MRSFWYFTFYSEFFITHKKKKVGNYYGIYDKDQK